MHTGAIVRTIPYDELLVWDVRGDSHYVYQTNRILFKISITSRSFSRVAL